MVSIESNTATHRRDRSLPIALQTQKSIDEGNDRPRSLPSNRKLKQNSQKIDTRESFIQEGNECKDFEKVALIN